MVRPVSYFPANHRLWRVFHSLVHHMERAKRCGVSSLALRPLYAFEDLRTVPRLGGQTTSILCPHYLRLYINDLCEVNISKRGLEVLQGGCREDDGLGPYHKSECGVVLGNCLPGSDPSFRRTFASASHSATRPSTQK